MSISRDLSRSYQNQFINSVKAYFRYTRGIELDRSDLPRPRMKKLKPSILSSQEAGKILNSVANLKHSTILSILYFTGITVSEVVALTPADVDAMNKNLHIGGKRDKPGRTIPLSDELVNKIMTYQNKYEPAEFLFEGYHGKQLSIRSIQKTVKKYAEKAGINKKTSVQTLRHSFAVRHIEQGFDAVMLQELLGHRSPRTTSVYAFLASSGHP